MNFRFLLIPVAACILLACSGTGTSPQDGDDRFIVLGPSLVELIHVCGLSDRIVGIDRYTAWPPTLDAMDIGGYLDPSLEAIVALAPTSIHMVGESAELDELAASLGIPIHRYRFDTIEDVFASADTLSARYAGGAGGFRTDLEADLDSIAAAIGHRGVSGSSALVVVYHESGASSVTVAGRGTFFDGLLERMGCTLSAPSSGVWPMVSAEGVLELAPDVIICLFPDAADSSAIRRNETAYWTSLGFAEDRICSLFQSYLLIPGGRLGETAERMSECLPSR